MLEISWTTAGVEQGHGSMAVVHKLHRGYTASLLAARSLLHQCRVLFAKLREDTATRRLRARFEKLEAARPERITGRHVFLADCYSAVKKERQIQQLPNDTRLDIMKRHGEIFGSLPVMKRNEYEGRACNIAILKREELNLDRQHTVAMIQLQSARRAEDRIEGGALQCLMSNARFSDKQMESMNSMISTPEFAISRVLERRALFFVSPGKPSQAEQAALHEAFVPVFGDEPPDHHAEWVKQICVRRDHFHMCGIRGQIDGETVSFAILYACQRPYIIGLCRLERQDRAMPRFGEMGVAKQTRFLHGLFQLDFVMRTDQLTTSLDVQFDDGVELSVLLQLEYRPDFQVCSHFDPVSLSKFCAQFQAVKEPKKSSGDKPAEASRKLDYDLLNAFPWLERYVVTSEPSRPSPSSKKGSHICSAPVPELEPEEILEAWEQLDLRRRQWAEEDKYVGLDFETTIRGGAWTKAAKGVAYDCIMARPASEVGTEFTKNMASRRLSPSATQNTEKRQPTCWRCIGVIRCSICSTYSGTAAIAITCSARLMLIGMSLRTLFQSSLRVCLWSHRVCNVCTRSDPSGLKGQGWQLVLQRRLGNDLFI